MEATRIHSRLYRASLGMTVLPHAPGCLILYLSLSKLLINPFPYNQLDRHTFFIRTGVPIMRHETTQSKKYLWFAILTLTMVSLACQLPFVGQKTSTTPDDGAGPTAEPSAQTTVSTEDENAGSSTPTPLAGIESLPPTNFLELVEEGVEQGRWSRGEGILYLVEYLAGERALEYEVAEQEGTMIYGLAKQYIALGENEEIKEKLQSKLQELLGALHNLEDYAVPRDEYSQKGSFKVAAQTTPEDCGALWKKGFPKLQNKKCLLYQEAQAGGVTVKVYYPVGWQGDAQKLNYVQVGFEALQKSAETYQQFGSSIDMAVIFSPARHPNNEDKLATTLFKEFWDDDVCPMVIHNRPDKFQQGKHRSNIAHEAFHCYQYWHVFKQAKTNENYTNNLWWTEGSADHFSNVVYPDIKDNQGLVRVFDIKSRTQSLYEMTYENYVFFTDWMNQRGNQDLVNFLHTISLTESAKGQMEDLAQYYNTDVFFQRFGERYMDNYIPDPGGDLLPIPASINREISINGTGKAFEVSVKPFQLYRLKGHYPQQRSFAQRMEYERNGMTTMRRTNAEGIWNEVPEQLFSRCEAGVSYYFLITSTDTGGEHTSSLLIDQTKTAACDGCLVGDWAVQNDSFTRWFNNLAAQSGSGSMVTLENMSGLMGAQFGEGRLYTSINKELILEFSITGQANQTLRFTSTSIGEGTWFTNGENTHLSITQQSLRADFKMEIPGIGEIPLGGGTVPEEALPPGYEEFGAFSDLQNTTFFGTLSTEAEGNSRSYTCNEDTLTIHYPQISDLIFNRLDEPIELPMIGDNE